jgi:hypothetical protein
MAWYNDLLGTVGKVASTAIAATGPVGLIVSSALNMFLEEDDKVTKDTPLSEVEAKYNKLSPEQQALVSTAYYDYLKSKDEYAFKTMDSVNNKDVESLRIKELADGGDGAIRPFAVKLSVISVCVVSMTYCVCMFIVAIQGADATMVLPSWEQLSAALALQSWIIRSYFTDRSNDKANKLNAYGGHKCEPKESMLSKTIKSIRS